MPINNPGRDSTSKSQGRRRERSTSRGRYQSRDRGRSQRGSQDDKGRRITERMADWEEPKKIEEGR